MAWSGGLLTSIWPEPRKRRKWSPREAASLNCTTAKWATPRARPEHCPVHQALSSYGSGATAGQYRQSNAGARLAAEGPLRPACGNHDRGRPGAVGSQAGQAFQPDAATRSQLKDDADKARRRVERQKSAQIAQSRWAVPAPFSCTIVFFVANPRLSRHARSTISCQSPACKCLG